MALKHFIEKLSTDMGFEQALEANEDGSYSLRLEPDIFVTLRENSDACISMQAQLAPMPTINPEAFLLKAMAANLLGRETGGAALGLDAEGKKVVLMDFLPEEQTYREFHDSLEDFINYADAWREDTIEFIEQQDVEE